MCQAVTIEVSPGELVDKLTILEIKLDRISDAAKRHNVGVERDLLAAALERLGVGPDIAELAGRLREVNESLWTIEDEIRDCERRGDFGAAFVAYARAVYVTNDRRAELKRSVNLALGSRLMEEKSYRRYTRGDQPEASLPRFHQALTRNGRRSMPALKRAVPAWPAPSQRHPSLVWYEMGTAHLRAGRLDEAVAALDTALRLRPAFPEALRVGGTILRDRGASEAALGFLGEAIRLRPGYRDAVLDKSNLLLDLGRDEEALATLDAALAHAPDAGLLCNKGSILDGLGHLPEACAVLQAAIATDPALPEAHLNYGAALMRLFRHAEALPVLDRALALRPTSAAAHANRGLALKMLGRFDDAAAALERALALEPDNAYALTNRGELRLLLGNYAGGWPDYQARLATEWHDAPLRASPVWLWAGEPLQGLRVLAVADAGNGDILQFARFVPMLVAAGARVTIVCKGRLHRLLAPLFRGTRVVEKADDAETFDCLVPFSSLPFVFATDTASIPAQVPYLAAEPSRVASWRDRIGTRGLRIGLCWRGSQDWRSDPNRSIALAAFAPLAALPDVRLVALNIDTDGMDTADVPLLRFDDLDAGPDAFVDTAAVMTQLDLVVTIDTSLAHLAGALGRPTFLLLRKVPDWRWLLDRDDTPWYPTMRLLRQERAGDWTAPLARLVEAIRHLQRVSSPAVRVTNPETGGAIPWRLDTSAARSRSPAWRATRAPGSGFAETPPLVAAS